MKTSVGFVAVLLISLFWSSVLANECEKTQSFVCYGSRMIHTLLRRLNQTRKPVVIFPGLEIVTTASANDTDNMIELEDDTLIGGMTSYLEHHEVNIKLAEFFGTTELLEYLSGEVERNQPVAESRKKDNKTYMVAISLMFGKLLTVLGIGSIGALAMKALGVASMALLMTGMMGLKNLHQNNEESNHHVQYVTEGHHRRRRQAHPPAPWPLAYRSWKTGTTQQ